MNFIERILNRSENPKDPLDLLRSWIAKSPSRQSAMPDRSWLPHYRTAREAEMILFLGLFLPEWETWEIVARIRESCYFQKYSGEWRQVQEILERVTDLGSLEKELDILMTDDDFFGNFLKESNNFLKRNPFSFKPVVRDRRKPKRMIRHRGYRDKGSLRPLHRSHRNLPDPDPGEDRRSKVKYGYLPDI